MAQRRMFSKNITNSSKFLKMPMSTRLLYYDLGMNADDDGFVEHFMVLRMTGATQQDLGVLQANNLIKIFDENVLWIRDWKENNYIRNDRYQPSKYIAIYNLDTIGIPEVSTGKDRIELDKDNKKEINKEKYGEFKNVLLTKEEYHKLEKSNLLPYIEKLSSYIASKGKKYKSHYATILNWSRNDKKDSIEPEWLGKEYVKEINEEAEEVERRFLEELEKSKKNQN